LGLPLFFGFFFSHVFLTFIQEGLAMINGTQMMSSIGAEATVRARNLAVTADIACALSVEALQGTPRAFEVREGGMV